MWSILLSSGSGCDAGRSKKTGCRRRIVIKEDLAAEERKTEAGRAPVMGPSLHCRSVSHELRAHGKVFVHTQDPIDIDWWTGFVLNQTLQPIVIPDDGVVSYVSGSGRDAGRRKKTGCRRRTVIKEDLAAEERRKTEAGRAPMLGPSLQVGPMASLFHAQLLTSTQTNNKLFYLRMVACSFWPSCLVDRYQRRPGCGRKKRQRLGELQCWAPVSRLVSLP